VSERHIARCKIEADPINQLFVYEP
jgi:hypothetical protein